MTVIKGDYSSSTIGVTHTLGFYSSLAPDYATPADIIDGPLNSMKVTFIGTTHSTIIRETYQGDFYDKASPLPLRFQPTSDHIYSIDNIKGYGFKIFAAIPAFPDIHNFVKASYTDAGNFLIDWGKFKVAISDWSDAVDSLSSSRVEFGNAAGSIHGIFTSSRPIAGGLLNANAFDTFQQNIIGTSFGDVIDGSLQSDTLNGSGGTDILKGGKGEDSLYGGSENDTLSSGKDSDRLEGGTGSDILDGGTGSDFIIGDEGVDTLAGGIGNDWIFAGKEELSIDSSETLGANLLDGGIGEDNLYSWTAATNGDFLTGGSGPDHFNVNGGDTIMDFSSEDVADMLSGSTTGLIKVNSNALLGTTITFYNPNMKMISLLSLSGQYNPLQFSATAGPLNQFFAIKYGKNDSAGLSGREEIGGYFYDKANEIRNEALPHGVEVVKDSIADWAKDEVHANHAFPLIAAKLGLDGAKLVGKAMASVAFTFGQQLAGEFDELTKEEIALKYVQAGSIAVLSAAATPELLVGIAVSAGISTGVSLGRDLFKWAIDAYFDVIDADYTFLLNPLNIQSATIFRHVQIGTDHADRLTGDGGQDRLEGGAGNDTLHGGGRNDVLNGGGGDDKLSGGQGADVFRFTLVPDSMNHSGQSHPLGIIGKDTVTDFERGVDKLLLQGVIFADLSITGSATQTRVSWVDGEVVLTGIPVGIVNESDFVFV